MGPVAERRILGMFAKTPSDRLLLFNHPLDGGPFRALVTTVAEGLVRGLSAGAPPIGSGLHLLHARLGCANFRWFHVGTLAPDDLSSRS